jgi:DNA-binding NarL/FixJ family response regulator
MKRGHILLADRDVESLEGMRILLEPLCATVVMVADSVSLERALRCLHPDLVIVGLSMKIQGEVNVARHLQRHHPQLKFILLSGHRHPSVVKEALAAGASGFLLRQTVASELIMAVRAVRQNRLFISPVAETPLWPQSHISSSIH